MSEQGSWRVDMCAVLSYAYIRTYTLPRTYQYASAPQNLTLCPLELLSLTLFLTLNDHSMLHTPIAKFSFGHTFPSRMLLLS